MQDFPVEFWHQFHLFQRANLLSVLQMYVAGGSLSVQTLEFLVGIPEPRVVSSVPI